MNRVSEDIIESPHNNHADFLFSKRESLFAVYSITYTFEAKSYFDVSTISFKIQNHI